MDIPTLQILSLCSGVGGLELGLKLAMPTARTVAYVEGEAYACHILDARMQEQVLDGASVEKTVKLFLAVALCGRMLRPSTANRGVAKWIASLEDTHASRL